jgi:type IV fimbrial biogenesis protein FimT
MLASKGFTLVGLMVAVAILSILITTAIPSFNLFLIKLRASQQIAELSRLLLLARNSAINYGQDVTVCPLDANAKCSTNWHQEISVFIDNDNDDLYSIDQDLLLKVKPALTHQDNLLYAKGRKSVKYNATGRLAGWGMNGTFRYCPKDHDELAKGIVVSVSGRLYATTDVDQDGKDENRSRQELLCR